MENTKEDKFKCIECNSVSFKTPGTCCNGNEREKVCSKCGHMHDSEICECGCSSF